MHLLPRLTFCCAAMLACCSAGCESGTWKLNRWDGPKDTSYLSVWDDISEADLAEFRAAPIIDVPRQ